MLITQGRFDIAPATTAPRITLRPYQQEAIDATVGLWDAGMYNVLTVLPTGTGKTIMFAGLLQQRLRPNMRALILAHRDELIQQPKEKLAQVWPEAYVGIVKAEMNQVHAPVVCASVQTLSSAKRIKQLLQAGLIDILVVDEAHHAVAKGYVDVIGALREANPNLCHLGVTATPNRADKKGLISVYDVVAYERDILWGIESGYLVPLVGKAVDAQLDLSSVGVRAGDYVPDQLTAALEVNNWRDLIVEAWKQEAPGRPTLAFTVSVAMAESLAATFNSHGISAGWVCGETPQIERRRILADYQAGRLQVVCNMGVLTEGFDAPHTSCVIMARPTKSPGLWIQCVGRGTRLSPESGKRDCVVLEFADNGHTAIQLTDLVGKKPTATGVLRQQMGELDQTPDDLDAIARQMEMETADADKLGTGKPITRMLDLLGGKRLAWYEHQHELSLGLDLNRSLLLLPPQGDKARERIAKADAMVASGRLLEGRSLTVYEYLTAAVDHWQVVEVSGRKVTVLYHAKLQRALVWAEQYARKHGAPWAINGTSRAHGQPATDAQLSYMARCGLPIDGAITKGTAMAALGHVTSRGELLDQRYLAS